MIYLLFTIIQKNIINTVKKTFGGVLLMKMKYWHYEYFTKIINTLIMIFIMKVKYVLILMTKIRYNNL